jgi:hypothetical protein
MLTRLDVSVAMRRVAGEHGAGTILRPFSSLRRGGGRIDGTRAEQHAKAPTRR